MYKLLLIDDLRDADSPLLRWIEAEFLNARIETQDTLQKGIEALDAGDYQFIVCRYSGNSEALLDALAKSSKHAPILLLHSSGTQQQTGFLVRMDRMYVIGTRPSEDQLKNAIETLRKPALAGPETIRTPDQNFIRFSSLAVDSAVPIGADVYARLGLDHYVKVYRAEDVPPAEKLREELRQRRISHYYIRKDEIGATLQNKTRAIDRMIQDPHLDRTAAENLVEEVVEVTQDVVAKIGFTPEIQEIVKRTAQMVIKLISKDDNLSKIIERLNLNEGRYITSHSLMLGEVACAIAHRIGWDSPSTYLKLSVSALMHDLTLRDNSLARVNQLSGKRAPAGLSKEQMDEVRLHPVRAAEYAHQFQEMPPDVDAILSQHHERPDGTGFPRGLFHTRIHPLAALFIIAHDVLDEYMSGRKFTSIEDFLESQSEIYAHGTFKKIAQAIIQHREMT